MSCDNRKQFPRKDPISSDPKLIPFPENTERDPVRPPRTVEELFCAQLRMRLPMAPDSTNPTEED